MKRILCSNWLPLRGRMRLSRDFPRRPPREKSSLMNTQKLSTSSICVQYSSWLILFIDDPFFVSLRLQNLRKINTPINSTYQFFSKHIYSFKHAICCPFIRKVGRHLLYKDMKFEITMGSK